MPPSAGRSAQPLLRRPLWRKLWLGPDLVVGAVLIPGAAAPKMVAEETVSWMKPGSVIVDYRDRSAGCFETSRPTTHRDPVFKRHGVTHYCMTNMLGAVARTSAVALNHATIPYVRRIEDEGVDRALATDRHLAAGLNVSGGKIRHPAVAAAWLPP